MSVYGIVGDLGTGKTLCMTTIGYNMFRYEGFHPYSNYKLNFPHSEIKSVGEITKVKTSPNVFLLDEIWISADSRNSTSDENKEYSTNVLQSRKMNSEIFYTTQYTHQVEKRIRNITSLFFQPYITARDVDGLPALMSVRVMKRNLYGALMLVKVISINVYGMHLLYDTNEIVKPNMTEEIERIVEKYNDEGFKGKKSTLISRLTFDEGMTDARAKRAASYVMDRLGLL